MWCATFYQYPCTRYQLHPLGKEGLSYYRHTGVSRARCWQLVGRHRRWSQLPLRTTSATVSQLHPWPSTPQKPIWSWIWVVERLSVSWYTPPQCSMRCMHCDPKSEANDSSTLPLPLRMDTRVLRLSYGKLYIFGSLQDHVRMYGQVPCIYSRQLLEQRRCRVLSRGSKLQWDPMPSLQ